MSEFKLTDAERQLVEEVRRREAQRAADEAARKTRDEQVGSLLAKPASLWTKADSEFMRSAIAEFQKEGL
jgi:hypothetical protein